MVLRGRKETERDRLQGETDTKERRPRKQETDPRRQGDGGEAKERVVFWSCAIAWRGSFGGVILQLRGSVPAKHPATPNLVTGLSPLAMEDGRMLAAAGQVNVGSVAIHCWRGCGCLDFTEGRNFWCCQRLVQTSQLPQDKLTGAYIYPLLPCVSLAPPRWDSGKLWYAFCAVTIV